MDVLFPPGPQKSLLLGDAPHFKRNPLDYLLQSARAYGDLVHFRFGPSHAYLLTNPRDAHAVLVEHFDQFADEPSLLRALNSAMGHDLFAPKEKVTKRTLRRGVFKAAWLDPFVDAVARMSAQRLDLWQGGDPLPLLDDLTLPIVAQTLFGESEGQLRSLAVRLDRALAARRDDRDFQSPLTLPTWIPTPRSRQRRTADRAVRQIVGQLIAEYRAGGRSGLLLCLLQAADTEAHALEELLALFSAGRDALTHTLAWAWSLLAQNPDAADALQAEVAAVLGGRLPSADDLPNLVYCEMVFKETLRLHPPVGLISRQAKKETRLGEYYVPAGSTIFISPYVVHHSARYYTSPERFLPERFGESLARRSSTYAYMPFGAGIYAEAEREYATSVGKLILALAAQRFRLSLLADASDTGLSPRPRGLNLRPQRIKAAASQGI